MLRVREFTMKDSYSLDRDQAGLDASYDAHAEAYSRIMDRCGLHWYMVESDTGMMGGTGAHEFMAPSPAGEDTIVRDPAGGYAANVEVAASVAREPDFGETPERAAGVRHPRRRARSTSSRPSRGCRRRAWRRASWSWPTAAPCWRWCAASTRCTRRS